MKTPTNEIWNYYRGKYKIYTEDRDVKNKLNKLKDVNLQCIYEWDDKIIAWDFIFPSKKLKGIKELI